MADQKKTTDASGKLLMDKGWEHVQKKTFTKWVNSHLAKRGQKIEELTTDFKDGLKLMTFLEVIGNHKFISYEKKPKIRIQSIQNNMLALGFLKEVKVPLVNITAEDIVDGNLKLILGMIWTIIQRFQISDISEEELSAKEALMLWCRKKTAGYRDVKIDNFHTSWQDGMAFLALIHKHRPDLVNYDSLKRENGRDNLQLAFDIAEQHLGITKLLDVEDIVDVPRPDEHSMITYIAQFYHAFSSGRKQEAAGQRIGRLVDTTMTNEQLKADYLERSTGLVEWMNRKTTNLNDRNFPNSLDGIEKAIGDHNDYKNNEKPPKAAEKLSIESLFNTLNLKLRSGNRDPFVAPTETSVAEIDRLWEILLKAEQEREDALAKELERQEKLSILNRQLNNKASKLEAWIATKQKLLNKEEQVDSLGVAQEKVRQHDNFYEEYAASKSRLDELDSILKEIEALNDPNFSSLKERNNKITSDWEGLQGLADTKKERLRKMLDIQIRMENLRLDFAKQAKEYNLWVSNTIDKISNTDFPDSLEEIEGHKGTLDSEDQSIQSTSNEKKAALDKLAAEMQELGAIDNKYTAFTSEDIAKRHMQVGESIKSRQEAYNAELARQREMEDLRKEFARLAQEFVDHLSSRQTDVKGLLSNGELEAVIGAINAAYDDGKPDKAKLEPIAAHSAKMSEMGINSNKHTDLNYSMLNRKNDQLGNSIAQEIALLIEEKELRADYDERVADLLRFINETTVSLKDRTADNTLKGAQQQSSLYREYKTGKKTEYSAKKPEVEALFNTISAVLKQNNRPEFNPPHSIDEISQLWNQLEDEERKKEEFLRVELARQEKLAYLVRRFNSDADDLDTWNKDKEKYVAERENADSLFKAQFNLRLFDAYNDELRGRENYLSQLDDLAKEIGSLDYADISTIEGRKDEIHASIANMKTGAEDKKAHLEEQLKVQQGNENIRLEFARLAKEFNEWVKRSAESIRDYNFGFNVDAVTAYRDELTKSDSHYNSELQAKKTKIDEVHQQAQNAGIKDNRHTRVTAQDIESFASLLNDEMAKRQAAYAAELAKQENFDARRKQFASKAQGFVDHVASARKNLEQIEGGADDKIEKITAAHNEGAGGKTLIDDITADAADMNAQGIYGNNHTRYTLPILVNRNKLHNNYVNNLVTSVAEEKGLEERIKAQEAELARREKADQMVVEFSSKYRALNTWMESVEDSLDAPVNPQSVEDADKLSHEHAEYESQRAEKAKDHEALIELANRMKAAGITDFSGVTMEDITEKWDGIIGAGNDKKKAIDVAVEKQKKNDAIARDYAAKANAIHTYVDAERSQLASSGKSADLDAQLDSVIAQTTKYESTGRKLMKELEEAQQVVSAALVKPGKHTNLVFRELQVQFEQLKSSFERQDQLITGEITKKKGTDLTPEQITEFKEVFNHFDRDGSGKLNRLELKSVLASLGEEPNDAELDAMMTSLDPQKLGGVNFDSFAGFMKSKSKDQGTKEEIIESFKSIANDKDFVTEEELRRTMDNPKVAYLLKNMPKYAAVDNGYDYRKWAEQIYGK